MNTQLNTQSKRLVICCDGTWDSHKQPTNVEKIVRSIKPYDSDGRHQVLYYDQGIGNYNHIDRLIGATLGKGIEQNVLDAYRFIAHNYQSGDEIYCFGASRGAYTARALAGMLHTVGLLPKDQLRDLPQAYKHYRRSAKKRNNQEYAQYHRPEIQVMAVWDSIGASGAPIPLLGRLSKPLVSFCDNHLSPEIKHAYQALAIDETRAPYQPSLWTGNINADQNVEQVWFSGMHADVTGGYNETGLSDIALSWMIQKVSKLGLEFDQDYLADSSNINANIMDKQHESFSLPYRWLEKLGMIRGIRQLNGKNDESAINVSVHETVMQRIEKLEDYQVANLEDVLPVSRTDERRHFTRMTTNELQGEIKIDSQTTSCEILDYSPLGGVRVKCDGELDKLDEITISSSRFAKTLATYAWKKGNIYGLNFAA